MENEKISIISTIYNVEKYLGWCVRSLRRQTYPNLEIILVNDASPDGSLRICQRYAAADSRIKVMDLPVNHGLNKARFKGVEVATGDYLLFVDSDDWLAHDTVKTLYRVLKQEEADVVSSNFYKVYDSWGLFKRAYPYPLGVWMEDETLELTRLDTYALSFWGEEPLRGSSLCGKLYRRSLFDQPGVEPNELKFHEDWLTNLQLMPYIRKEIFVKRPLYFYRYGGMTTKYAPALYEDSKWLYEYKKEKIHSLGLQEALVPNRRRMCRYLGNHLAQMFRAGIDEETIRIFLEREEESGFIGEITDGVEVNSGYIPALKKKDIRGAMEYFRRSVHKGLWRWRLFNGIFPLLRYI
ncbi:MAG: glycosyltransferase [Mediterranea sp.]|jgi:glycosyltransferase involved in cell wall biosynthesis|nr:glycosyltransferase [Mediterranea sp.]